jgi:hypothetical protein
MIAYCMELDLQVGALCQPLEGSLASFKTQPRDNHGRVQDVEPTFRVMQATGAIAQV